MVAASIVAGYSPRPDSDAHSMKTISHHRQDVARRWAAEPWRLGSRITSSSLVGSRSVRPAGVGHDRRRGRALVVRNHDSHGGGLPIDSRLFRFGLDAGGCSKIAAIALENWRTRATGVGKSSRLACDVARLLGCRFAWP